LVRFTMSGQVCCQHADAAPRATRTVVATDAHLGPCFVQLANQRGKQLARPLDLFFRGSAHDLGIFGARGKRRSSPTSSSWGALTCCRYFLPGFREPRRPAEIMEMISSHGGFSTPSGTMG
jgi:hypothetical protein